MDKCGSQSQFFTLLAPGWKCILLNYPFCQQTLPSDLAFGISNRHPGPLSATVDFKQIGFNRSVKARDLWQQKDLGNLGPTYTVKIAGHGVILLRVSQ